MPKILKIEFSKKTSSKSLPEALRLSQKLKATTEQDLVRIELDIKEVFNLWEWINSLLNIVGKWKDFDIYYKDRVCNDSKEFKRLFYDLQEIRMCYHTMQDDPEDYEKCNDKWGCKKLKYISLGLRDAGVKHWFEYGHQVNNETWEIDKNRILNEMQIEIDRKHLKACPAFPLKRIQDVIEALPGEISLDKNWEVEYTNELISGEMVKVSKTIHFNALLEEDWHRM